MSQTACKTPIADLIRSVVDNLNDGWSMSLDRPDGLATQNVGSECALAIAAALHAKAGGSVEGEHPKTHEYELHDASGIKVCKNCGRCQSKSNDEKGCAATEEAIERAYVAASKALHGTSADIGVGELDRIVSATINSILSDTSEPDQANIDMFNAAIEKGKQRIATLSPKLQEPVGWLYEWPNGRKEFRSSDKPKDFDAWAATITPLYTSPTLAHQPATAGWERALEPFALISSEGVVTQKEGHVTITTCAEYFHRAAEALAALKSEGRNDG